MLLVEDEMMSALVIKEVGHDVVHAMTAKEAVAELNRRAADLPRACSGDDARDPVYRLLAPATTLAQCQGGYDGRLHVPALQRQVNKLAADLLPIYGELRLVWLLPVRAFSPFVIE